MKRKEPEVEPLNLTNRPEFSSVPLQVSSSDLKRELEYSTATNLLSNTDFTDRPTNRPIYIHRSYTEGLLDRLDPEFLYKYEGSYTTEELREHNDENTSLALSTGWISGQSNLPQIDVIVEHNPVTGKYEVSGGGLFLPRQGLGVSYEEDQSSGESKTFLKWKTDF